MLIELERVRWKVISAKIASDSRYRYLPCFQMSVSSPVSSNLRSRKPELKNEEISFEDLSMQHDDHGVGNRFGSRVFAQRKITVSENEVGEGSSIPISVSLDREELQSRKCTGR